MNWQSTKTLRKLVWPAGLIAAVIFAHTCIGSWDGPSLPPPKAEPTIGFIPSEKLANGIFGSLVYSADSKSLAAAAGNGTVRIYDAITARERSAFMMKTSNQELRASARIWVRSPDDQLLLMNGYTQDDLQLVDAHTGELRRKLEKLDQARPLLRSVIYSSDGRFIAAGCQDSGEVFVWDAVTGRRRFKTPAHIVPAQTEPFPRAMQPIPAPIYSLAFTPDSSLLLWSSIGAPLRCWNVATATEVDPPVRIMSPDLLTLSPDGKLIVVSDRVGVGSDHSRRTMLYDMTTWKKRSEWVTPSPPVRQALLAGGQHLISMGYANRTIELRDTGDGRLQSQFDVQIRGPIECMAVSPDGKHIAIGGFNDHPMFGAVQLIEVDGSKLLPWKPQP